MSDFRKIAFGFASAETERSHDPGLLLDGYIDFKGAAEEARVGHKYLFLGYKGTGKSAIGQRIQLSAADRYSEFVKLVPLQDFPFTPFSKIIRGDAEPETKFPTAWSWILLTYLLDSFSRDNGLQHSDMTAFQDAVSAFRKMGLTPTDSPADIVRKSAKNAFKLSLPGKLAEYSWSGSDIKPASEIPNFVESIKQLIYGIRSQNRHLLIIDGLDDIFTSRDIQYKSLSALIFEVARLNESLQRNQVSAKIVLLCRTDIFERIPGPNKNKVRQDYALELDWYNDPRDPEQSLLVQVARLRTNRSLGNDINLFKRFFPNHIDGTEVPRLLLDMTRHTPRDFLRLLHHIQEFSGPGLVNSNMVKSGMREYSIKYFLPEIHDELSGYAQPEEIGRLFSIFGRLRKRQFKWSELEEASGLTNKTFSRDRLHELVELLFECSALGNIQNRSGGNTYFTFKYRNRHSTYNEGEQIILHRGLWKALNLV